MILEIENLLVNTDELKYIQNSKIKNFKIDNSSNYIPKKSKGNVNYYNRRFINIKSELLDFQKNIKEFIKNTYKLDVKIDAIWINKIDKKSNTNDSYHNDISDLTYILYLNDSYTGGEFEYKENDETIKQFIPKKYSQILQNNNLLHRVLPVKNGIRYSLVCFMYYEQKTKKSLV